jgi:hypothetical protein
MNSKIRLGFLASVVIATMHTGYVQAQQIPFPQTAAEVPGPVPGTAMTKEYVQMVGRAAGAIRSSPRAIVAQRSPRRLSASSWAGSFPLPQLATTPC